MSSTWVQTWPQSEEEEGRVEGKKRGKGIGEVGGGGLVGHRGTGLVTWECIRVYMRKCVRLRWALGSSVTREMDVLASSEGLQLVERLRKRCLGSHPVRGEFASVLPWHRSGLWSCVSARVRVLVCVCEREKESECACLVWVHVFMC